MRAPQVVLAISLISILFMPVTKSVLSITCGLDEAV